jgi:hypothetical protein
VSTSPTLHDFDGEAHDYYVSVQAAAPDRILAMTVPGGITGGPVDSQHTIVLTMNPDGTGASKGAFFDRGTPQLQLSAAIYHEPYFYVLWQEETSTRDLYVGRFDHDGKPVGTPLAVGHGSAVGALTAAGDHITVALSENPKVTVKQIDAASFTLTGTPVQIGDGTVPHTATGVAEIGGVIAVAGYTYDATKAMPQTTPELVIIGAAGATSTVTAGDDIQPAVAANGGAFLFCSADRDGDFGPGRTAYRQWCRPVALDGTLGPRVELGYRSNFLRTFALPFAGGFAVEMPGFDDITIALWDPAQHLSILDLDGTIKQQIEVKLGPQTGDSYDAPPVVAGGCLSLVHWMVQTYNVTSSSAAIQQYCPAACQ